MCFRNLRVWAFLAAVALCCAALGQGQVQYSPGEILIRVKPGYDLVAQSTHQSIGAQVTGGEPKLGIQKLSIPPSMTVNSAVSFYRGKSFVVFAEPNYIFDWSFVPNDPLFGAQYHHQRIQTPAAWDLTTGATNVVIYVLDSGVDSSHPDLAPNLLPGYDFVNEDPIPEDNVGHGTHVSGIASAATNNALGIAGVGFNCKIRMGKVGEFFLLTEDIVQGITWAADEGAHVINMSFGGYAPSQAILTAVNYAWNKGSVLVAAAGNDNTSLPLYPAAFPNVIAVGSTNQSDQKSDFSNFGTWVNVAAPGSLILSTVVGGGYEAWDGTSMASPVVAGVVGLIWSRASGQTSNLEVRNTLESTCDPVGTWVVKGRVNAFRAVQSTFVLVDVPHTAIGVSAFQGSITAGDVGSLAAVDGDSVQLDPIMVERQGRIASAIVDFQTTENLATANRLSFKLNGQAVRGSTGMFYLYNWSTGKWRHLRSFPLTEASAGNTLEVLAPKPFNQWKNGSGQIRMMYRAITPARNPVHYNLQIERTEMVVRKRQ